MCALFKIIDCISILVINLNMLSSHSEFTLENFVHFRFVIILKAENLSVIISQVIVMDLLCLQLQKWYSDFALVVEETSLLQRGVDLFVVLLKCTPLLLSYNVALAGGVSLVDEELSLVV